MKRIVTYNVNGIRSALQKGLLDWLKATDPDVLLLQELKADANQGIQSIFENLGYHVCWHDAEKKGYSGVAIISKEKPNNVEIGCGIPLYDREGRVAIAHFEGYSVMSLYLPSGSSGEDRQDFKFKMMDEFYPLLQDYLIKYPNLIIGGDFNICHKDIDIHNPKSNAKSSGFLPEERAWMEKLFTTGWVDTFRQFNENPHQYTWWSFRSNARAKNLGWRIDYLICPEAFSKNLRRAVILPEAKHSDHCPVLLEVEV